MSLTNIKRDATWVRPGVTALVLPEAADPTVVRTDGFVYTNHAWAHVLGSDGATWAAGDASGFGVKFSLIEEEAVPFRIKARSAVGLKPLDVSIVIGSSADGSDVTLQDEIRMPFVSEFDDVVTIRPYEIQPAGALIIGVVYTAIDVADGAVVCGSLSVQRMDNGFDRFNTAVY